MTYFFKREEETMKGFHVEEPPSLHSSRNPVLNLVGNEHAMFSPHLKPEGISRYGFAGKPQPPHIHSSSQSINKPSMIADERGHYTWPECNYGGLPCTLAETNNWVLGNMAVPFAEKEKNQDEYVCRGRPHMETMEGHDGQAGEEAVRISRGASKVAYVGDTNGSVGSYGDHHIRHPQASIAAPSNGVNCDRMFGFNGFERNDVDHSSTFHDSIAASTKGNGHLGRFIEHMGNRGNHVDDLQASMAALTCESPPGDNPFWRFLPANNEKHSMDLTSCDEFCMYEFKVRRCMRGRSHDWTECPYAHPGEKARRRDPRCFNYSGTACADFRRGACRRGDSCDLSHGVFECWLHPARYRTQLCKDGKACKRRVCFFAHSPSQLRLVCPSKSLEVPLASSKDARVPLFTKQASTVGYGALNGYGADGLFHDFSPKSMPSFPLYSKQASTVGYGALNGYGADGFHDFSPRSLPSFPTDDGSSPMGADSHGLKNSKESPLDRDSNRYGHWGMPLEDHSSQFELINNGDGSFSVTNGPHLADDNGYESSNGHSYCHTSSTLVNSSLEAEATFRSQLALASLKGSLDQLTSPTSTLAAHVFSPPPLSPPLSPAASPPKSPGTALSTWSTALSRKIASLANHPLPYDAFSQSPASGLDGTHAALLANMVNSNHGSSSVHTSMRGPSPLSTTSNEDKMHDMDKSHAMQSPIRTKDEWVQTTSMEANPQTQAMAHLISMLQQMELRRATTMDSKCRKRSPSLLQRIQSPKSRMEAGHNECWGAHGLSSHERDEAWQGLRGRLKANLSKEEIENPDLGWVNELVK